MFDGVFVDFFCGVFLYTKSLDLLQDVLWSDFGYPGRDGQESTIWIGTNGANTPCHQDTYGFNLVFQIQGR